MPFIALLLLAFLITPVVAETTERKATLAETVQLTHSLAEQGHARAQTMMGNYYADGTGVAKDLSKAFEWYQRAAQQGQKDAQFSLAVAHDTGEGTQQDLQKAAYWYEQAAMQGHDAAAYNLGILFDEGQGVKKDAIAALAWLKLAIALDNEMAVDVARKLQASQTRMQIIASDQMAKSLYEKVQQAQQKTAE